MNWRAIADAPHDGRPVLCDNPKWDLPAWCWYGEARGVTGWHFDGELEEIGADDVPVFYVELPERRARK